MACHQVSVTCCKKTTQHRTGHIEVLKKYVVMLSKGLSVIAILKLFGLRNPLCFKKKAVEDLKGLLFVRVMSFNIYHICY